MKKEKTIRETIKQCIHETPQGIIPIPFTFMLRSFAVILYLDAVMRTGKNADEEIMKVISEGAIFMPDNFAQVQQLQDFLKWWLGKKRHEFCESDEIVGLDFCDNTSLLNAWNQFAKERGAS